MGTNVGDWTVWRWGLTAGYCSHRPEAMRALVETARSDDGRHPPLAMIADAKMEPRAAGQVDRPPLRVVRPDGEHDLSM